MKLKGTSSGGHFYAPDGTPCHFIEKKDGSGLRATTVADARKNGWLPSPTTILGSLAKPALTEWLRQTAALAVLTTPRRDGEDLDAFVERALSVDAESIGDAAKQLGTDIHDAIEMAIFSTTGLPIFEATAPFVTPVLDAIAQFGRPVMAEKVLVGDGYAGRVDLVMEGQMFTVVDFKTTGAKKLPKKSHDEHAMQLSSYAAALGNTGDKPIQTANIYISTTRPGEISVCVNTDWQDTYERGFKPIMAYYKWSNSL